MMFKTGAWRRWLVGRKLQRCIESPIFVVGAGRSGTTALCEMLDRHSNILMSRGEGPIVHRFGLLAYEHQFSKKAGYYQHNTALVGETFRKAMSNLCLDCVWGPRYRVGLLPSQAKIRDLRTSSKKLLKRWGVKAFPDEHSAAGLIWLYPNAKFIYIFRNGIDVVRSMSKFPSFKLMSFEEKCRFWGERVFRYEYLRRHERAICVRFDNFVENSQEVCDRLFEHLALPTETAPATLSGGTIFHPLDGPTQAANPKSVFAQREPAYTSWEAVERNTFKKLCGKAMDLLEYEIPF
jgi:hypothetical protein